MTAPYMAPFDDDTPLILEPAANGGWVVRAGARNLGEIASIIGAFTDTRDMLRALNSALDPAFFGPGVLIPADLVTKAEVYGSPD